MQGGVAAVLAWRTSVRPTTGRRALAVIALVALLSTGCADADSPRADGGDRADADIAVRAGYRRHRRTLLDAPGSTGAERGPGGRGADHGDRRQGDPAVRPGRDPAGQHVRLTVTSDAADEVHVHEPYDMEFALEAGTPATEEFVADQPGLVEVELHESGKQLTQLLVK
jgi:hypothetical protein